MRQPPPRHKKDQRIELMPLSLFCQFVSSVDSAFLLMTSPSPRLIPSPIRAHGFKVFLALPIPERYDFFRQNWFRKMQFTKLIVFSLVGEVTDPSG